MLSGAARLALRRTRSPLWRISGISDLFTPSERAALCFAEGMTRTPAEVSDEVFAEAQRHFSTEQLVDLAATAAMENYRARFNRAFLVESQHFYERMDARPTPQ